MSHKKPTDKPTDKDAVLRELLDDYAAGREFTIEQLDDAVTRLGERMKIAKELSAVCDLLANVLERQDDSIREYSRIRGFVMALKGTQQ